MFYIFHRIRTLKDIVSFPFLEFYVVVPGTDDVMSKKRNSIVKSRKERQKECLAAAVGKFTPFPALVMERLFKSRDTWSVDDSTRI